MDRTNTKTVPGVFIFRLIYWRTLKAELCLSFFIFAYKKLALNKMAGKYIEIYIQPNIATALKALHSLQAILCKKMRRRKPW